MPFWSRPQRLAAYAEQALVTAILDGTYPPGSTLPGERELARQLGVTRPTLRETLQRLERDGWLTINQGKATRVLDYWREGGLNVLSALVRYGQLPAGLITHLLEVRLDMAPAYTLAAIQSSPDAVVACLASYVDLPDTPAALAAFDWKLHHTLTVASGNPIYTLMLNGFAGFYEEVGRIYFARPEARAASRAFYSALLDAARRHDGPLAARIAQEVMRESIEMWRKASGA